MANILIKSRSGFEQTGTAVHNYLQSINIVADLIHSDLEYLHKRHLYDKIYELDEVDCVDELSFVKPTGGKSLSSFYWGDFSITKLVQLYSLNKYVHIYSTKRWPIHNFIGLTNSYSDLNLLIGLYRDFYWFDTDPKWVYQTLVWAGCRPIQEKDIPILTAKEYTERLGICKN